jgi:hypothetical protein
MTHLLVGLPILAVLCTIKASSVQEVERNGCFDENPPNLCNVILAGEGEPTYTTHCLDNLKNRLTIALEISKLYGAFLRPEMHEEGKCELLQQRGMWIQKKCLYHPVLTVFQISLFISILEREVLESLEKAYNSGGWVHLGYDYGPTSSILEIVFQEVGLDADFYYLLPYKSHTYIHICDGEIIVNLNFKGPLI